MAVSIAQDPANYTGLANPISEAESTFAHEFAAHLLANKDDPTSFHNTKQKESVFYGEGDSLTGGRSVFQSDMKYLMFNYTDSTYAESPPGRGEKYVPQAATYPRLSSGTSERYANYRNNASAAAVYRWVAGVKR
jgi:hypothetical protein